MDIYKSAMKMELDGKAFYEKQAAATTDPDLKEILLTLAEEEERHFRFFHELSQDPDRIPSGDTFSAPGTIGRVQNIFDEMSQGGEKKTFGQDVVSAWREALQIEERAVAFYKEKAAAESDPARKSLLLRIAAEESNHVQMIDGVLMYLKHPETFADTAQFRDFQSLEGR